MKEQRYMYKEKAEDLMSGKYGRVIPTTIILGIAISGMSTLTTNFRAKYEFDWEAMTSVLVEKGNPSLAFIFSILSFIVGAIVVYSIAKMHILVSDDQKPEIEEIIIVGIKEQPFRSIVLQFLISLFTALWALLFIIPGIVKGYAYSMSFYLIIRNQDLTASEAIDKSKTLTKGNKGALFALDLSYLGWYILGIFTFGILWLWVLPKHRTARTLYFNEIYENSLPKKVIEAEDFSE